jgi:acetyltransferase-like isoleucine patch superfamily enzyme
MPAIRAHRPIAPDPGHETKLAAHLRATMTPTAFAELYGRFSDGLGVFDAMMRRAIWRALARSLGDGVTIAPRVSFRHHERGSIGSGVFIGEAAILQGHFESDCRIGDRVWIGLLAFLDARALVLEHSSAIGPGAKVLTAGHCGLPPEAAVMATEPEVGLVQIGAGADISAGALVLPGCRTGRGVIVGAGAVAPRDIPDQAVTTDAPAYAVRLRGQART